MSLLRPGLVNFDVKWAGLQETILSVVQLHRVQMTTWNDHYSDIYALCEAFPTSYSERVYRQTQQILVDFVSKLQQHLLQQDSHTALLSGYQKHWLSFQQGAKFLDNLFSYFNRVSLRKYQPSDTIDYALPGIHIPHLTSVSKDTPIEIRNMALRVWKEEMVEKVRKPLVKVLLGEIRRDREGHSTNLSMVRDIIFSLIEVEEYNKESSLKYYQEVFEGPFLAETGEFYRKEASKIVTDLSVSEYMEQVVARLQAANRRGQRFLHQTSVTKFIRECEARLVEDYKVDYLYTHVRAMVQEERRKDLSNLFILLSGIPRALDPVVTEFEEHVKSQGLSVLRRLQLDVNPNVSEFMSTVLDIHNKFNTIVKEVFGGHKLFYSALDRACTAFVNISEKPRLPKAPLLLAHYCDQQLRKSSKGVGEQEVEERLEKVITVFRYVDDKDTFQRFYSKMLSRRLVQSLSLSMEAEESMIQKLKHACGYEYTARLQRMVVDMRLSTDSMAEFQEYLKAREATLAIGFSTLVLQSAAWPLSRMQSGFFVPEELATAITRFEAFYTQKHNGRKLAWLHHMSIGELKMVTSRRHYTVCVTTFQMALLLAFNEANQHTYSSLLSHTHLRDTELTATLQSLVDCKLLLLNDGTEAVSTKSILKLNKTYSNKRTKFKVTAAFQKDSQQEIEQTQYSVHEDRKLHIQAAVVRVMKARKTLQHQLLIEETISQVKSRFIPNVQMIKRAIETLIDKQYIERVTDSRDTYTYMA